jgi:hypothetical protein
MPFSLSLKQINRNFENARKKKQSAAQAEKAADRKRYCQATTAYNAISRQQFRRISQKQCFSW